MIEAAIDYLINIGRQEEPFYELEGQYYDKNGRKVKNRVEDAITVKTLKGVVDFIKSFEYQVFIAITKDTVEVYTDYLNEYEERELLLRAENGNKNRFEFGYFMDSSDFNIRVQANFENNEDKAKVLLLSGNIKEENVRTTADDGTTQEVTVKQGVAMMGLSEVPNPVHLRPYSTFPDIEQPESKFIFRVKEGARMALFEVNDYQAYYKAIDSIKAYFEKELKELDYKVKVLG